MPEEEPQIYSPAPTPGSRRGRGHEHALASTLRWADEAAAGGDYQVALEWLAAIEAIGDSLPDAYQARRTAWSSARDAQRAACSP